MSTTTLDVDNESFAEADAQYATSDGVHGSTTHNPARFADSLGNCCGASEG
jgi:hypothetical protein